MKIKFTSVSSQEVSSLLRNVTVSLEDELKPEFLEKSFGHGVDQFVAVVVAVDPSPSENEKFRKQYHSVGKYKDVVTKEWVKFISVALPFDPEHLISMSEQNVRLELIAALLDRLDNMDLNIPKQFDYKKFAAQLHLALTNVDFRH